MTALAPRRGADTDAAVLALIRRAGRTTRGVIARELDVTPATVTNSVKRLLATGLVLETGLAPSTGGKRASYLSVDDSTTWALGCTVDEQAIALVAVDISGALRARVVIPVGRGTSADARQGGLSAALERVIPLLTDGAERIAGLGVSVGGGAEPGVGPVVRALIAALDVPVVEANAATCAALGNYWSVAEDQPRTFATVLAGLSTGFAILDDGRPSPRHAATRGGTLDHVCVDPAGPECWCGGRGCLHLLGSPRAAVQAALADPALAGELGLQTKSTGPAVTANFALLGRAAASGHGGALTVLERAAGHVALAVWNTIAPLEVEAIVLAGAGVLAAPAVYTGALRRLLDQRRGLLSAPVMVTVSPVQPHPGAIGAAALALQTFLSPTRSGPGTVLVPDL